MWRGSKSPGLTVSTPPEASRNFKVPSRKLWVGPRRVAPIESGRRRSSQLKKKKILSFQIGPPTDVPNRLSTRGGFGNPSRLLSQVIRRQCLVLVVLVQCAVEMAPASFCNQGCPCTPREPQRTCLGLDPRP